MRRKNNGEEHSHICGIVHNGYKSLRASYKGLQEELKNLEKKLPPDTGSRSRSREDEGGDRKRRRNDGPSDAAKDRETGDRRRDSDRPKRSGNKQDADEVDDRRNRERDARDDRRYRDREGRDRDRERDDRDSGRGRGQGRNKRERSEDFLDEFGRDTRMVGKIVQKSKEPRPKEDGIKIVQIVYSEDWNSVMDEKFEDLNLDQDAWDMAGFDRRGKLIRLDAEVVEITKDSFPLQFRFTRKEQKTPESGEQLADVR